MTDEPTDQLLNSLGCRRRDEVTRRLEAALKSSQLNGTSYQEAGKRVFVKPLNGESITFFHTDSPSFKTPLNAVDQRISDVFVFVDRSSSNAGLFIELSSGDESHCIDQLQTVISKFRNAASESGWRNFSKAAYIVSSQSAPAGWAKTQKRATSRLAGLKPELISGRRVDLRIYIPPN